MINDAVAAALQVAFNNDPTNSTGVLQNYVDMYGVTQEDLNQYFPGFDVKSVGVTLAPSATPVSTPTPTPTPTTTPTPSTVTINGQQYPEGSYVTYQNHILVPIPGQFNEDGSQAYNDITGTAINAAGGGNNWDTSLLKDVAQVALAYYVPIAGQAIGAALSVPTAVGTALASIASGVAQGKTLDQAVQSVGPSLISQGIISQTGLNDLITQIPVNPNYQAVINNVAGSVIATAAKGGNATDIVNNAVAAGGGTLIGQAVEASDAGVSPTNAKAIGQAIATNIATGQTMSGLTAGAGVLGSAQAAQNAAAATTPTPTPTPTSTTTDTTPPPSGAVTSPVTSSTVTGTPLLPLTPAEQLANQLSQLYATVPTGSQTGGGVQNAPNDYTSYGSFQDAFAAARGNLGSGQVFTFKGLPFSTDTAAENPALAQAGVNALPSSTAAGAGKGSMAGYDPTAAAANLATPSVATPSAPTSPEDTALYDMLTGVPIGGLPGAPTPGSALDKATSALSKVFTAYGEGIADVSQSYGMNIAVATLKGGLGEQGAAFADAGAALGLWDHNNLVYDYFTNMQKEANELLPTDIKQQEINIYNAINNAPDAVSKFLNGLQAIVQNPAGMAQIVASETVQEVIPKGLEMVA